jgi:hypothetical protein
MHVAQNRPIGQLPFGLHLRRHTFSPQMHTSVPGQGSFSSQAFGPMGTQAGLQSRQSGQLEVAHSSHVVPIAHASQKPSQAVAQVLLAKMHTPPGQSL